MRNSTNKLLKYIFSALVLIFAFYPKSIVYADTSSISISKVNGGDAMYVSGKNYFVKSGTYVWINQTYVTTKTMKMSYSRFMYNQNGGTYDTRGYHDWTQASTQYGTIFATGAVVVVGANTSKSGSTYYSNFEYNTSADGTAYDDDYKVETCYQFTDYTYSSGDDSVGSGVYYDSSLGYHLITDNTGPSAPSIHPSTGGWTSGNVTFTIDSSVDYANPTGRSSIGSGLSYYQYQIDSTGGAWTNSSSGTVSAEGGHTIYARAIDNLGNAGAISSTNVYIDKNGPNGAPSINLNRGGWGMNNITFTMSGGSDAVSGVGGYFYSIDGGSWTWYSGTVTINWDGWHTVEGYAMDNAGNWGGYAVASAGRDTVAPNGAPSINLNRGGWGTNSITFTMSGGSDALSGIGAYVYKIDGGSWTTYSSTVSLLAEGWHTVEGYTVDNAGNWGGYAVASAGRDITAPTVPTISPNRTTWGNTSISFTITNGTDSGSGVNRSEYQIDGGAWTTYSSTVSILAEGWHTANARTIDNVGNISSLASTSFGRDITAPTVPTITPSRTIWGTTSISFTITNGTDSGSGVNRTEYQVDGGTWTTYSSTVTIIAEGWHTINARTIDNAGNISSLATTTFGRDITAPTVPTISPNRTTWGNTDATFTISNGTDSGSGVNRSEYQIDGGAWTTYSSIVTVSTEGWHTVNARTIDNVGNISSLTTVTFGLEKTLPTGNFDLAGCAWTKLPVTVNFNMSDTGGSGFKNWRERISTDNGLTWGTWSFVTTTTSDSYTFTGEGLYRIQVEINDNAGNQTVMEAGTFRVDQNAPVVVNNINTGALKNGYYTVELTATDEGSGVQAIYYKWSNSNTVAPSSWDSISIASGIQNITKNISLNTDGTWYLWYYATDGIANASVAKVTSSFILENVLPDGTYNPLDADWRNSSIDVIFTPSDVSGIKQLRWRTSYDNGATYGSWSAPILSGAAQTNTVSGAGLRKLQYEVTDNAGNVNILTSGVYKIDTVNPTNPTITASTTSWTNSSITFTIDSSTDDSSGIAKYQYQVDSTTGTWIDGASGSYGNEGTHTIYARAIDNAGNISGVSSTTVRLDFTKPTDPTVTPSRTTWGNTDATVTITSGTDTLSGVAVTKYRTNGGAWNNYSTALTYSAEGWYTVEAQTYDNVGWASLMPKVSFGVDKTTPTGTMTIPSNTTDRNITVSFGSLADNLSGVSSIRVSNFADFSDSVGWINVSGATAQTPLQIPIGFSTKTVYGQIKDNAGNITTKTASIKLDALAPYVPVLTSPINDTLAVTGENLNINWTYNDPNNLLQSYAEVYFSNTETSTNSKITVNGTATNYVAVGLADGTYNIYTRVYNIDNKYSDSAIVQVRVNRFKLSGMFMSEELTSISAMKYVQILSNATVPAGTTLNAYILYPDLNGNYVGANKIAVPLTSVSNINNIQMLPYPVSRLKIEYDFTTSNIKVTPTITEYSLWGK